MTDEERFQKLTDRHEALAQSVELLLHSIDAQRRSIEEQRRGIEDQGRNIDRVLHIVEGQTTHIEALFTVSERLLHTAENHERRIDRIEGRQ